MSCEILVGWKELQKNYWRALIHTFVTYFLPQKLCSLQDSRKEYGTLREAKEVINKLNLTGHQIGAVCMPGN